MIYPGRGRRSPITALDDVSFEVDNGEFVSVIGPSGCGKSTLLKLIAGFERPTGGMVAVSGEKITGPGADRAVVFQHPALYPWLTVSDNVAFGLRLKGERRKNTAEQVDYFLERMGLLRFKKARPYELSGGMQQRVAIARALIIRPAIVLMDEPFGALDAQTRASMQDFLLELWQEINIAVIFITHDVGEAVLLSDRVVVLEAHPGRINDNVTVELPRPRSGAVELTEEFMAAKKRLSRRLGQKSLVLSDRA